MIKALIKKVGTGPSGHRNLTHDEAREAAGILLSRQATPAQIGALLLGLRLKGETAPEMSGFLAGLRDWIRPSLPEGSGNDFLPRLDVGEPYDGRSRSSSHTVPAATLAGRAGLRICLHGLSGVPVKMGPGVLEAWSSEGKAEGPLGVTDNVICLSQRTFLPELADMLPLRQELGLRTLWNTVEKAANPMHAPAQIIGIFHEPIIAKLHEALMAQKNPPQRLLFVAGVEGSTDLHPHRETVCHLYDRRVSPNIMQLAIPPGLKDPSIPQDEATVIRRQAALFLFAAGVSPDFKSALDSLEGLSLPTPSWSH
ncbi:MAG: anthranilate phosphoribosyltransferase [Leptospirillia bacterium]